MKRYKTTRLLLLVLFLSTSMLTGSALQVAAGPLQNFYQSPIPYWDDHSTSPVSLSWNATDQTVKLSGGAGTGNLTVGVPLEQKASQRVSISMNVVNLSSTVRLELCSDNVRSGHYADVNDTHVSFIDDSYGNLTDTLILDLYVNDDHGQYWITARNESGAIATYQEWFGLGGNNWLNITSRGYNGTLTLYYLDGDTCYLTVYNTPRWNSSVTTPNDNIYHSLGGLLYDGGTCGSLVSEYNVSLPYFQYLRMRVEYLVAADMSYPTACDFVFSVTIRLHFYNSTGHELYEAKARTSYAYDHDRAGGSESYVFAYSEVESDYSARNNEVYAVGGDWVNDDGDVFEQLDLQFAVWRTQEDCLGWYFESPNRTLDDTAGTVGSIKAGQEYVWSSELADANLTSCVDWSKPVLLEVQYEVEGAEAGDQYVDLELTQLEYFYFSDTGVAQPTFSSTFYSSQYGRAFGLPDGILVIEEDLYTSRYDPYNLVADPPDFNPWQFLIDALSNLGRDIAGFLGGALMAIPMLGIALVSGLMDLISPGLGTSLFSGVRAMGQAIANSISIIILVFSWIITAMGHIFYWLNYGLTLLTRPDSLLLIGCIVFLYCVDVYEKRGITGLAHVGYRVGEVCWRMVSWMLDFGLRILNTISGFIPFT